MKQYKAVPGPANINTGKGDMWSAFNAFAEVLNLEATGCWEFHSMDVITVTEKPGCMKQPIPTQHRMLIFVKDK